MTALPQLRATGTEGPTTVWHHDLPDWEWASQAQHAVLSITHALPREPWIELRTEAVAHFGYPARWLTHKCLGNPNKAHSQWHFTPRKLCGWSWTPHAMDSNEG